MRIPYVGRGLGGWRAVRRWTNRFEWGRRLLAAPISEDGDTPGLVLIQIDGLSRPRLEEAIQSGKMPFLKRLMSEEGYELHSHYSGLPSTTSAVQAEFFYGARSAVPAHSFLDRTTGKVVEMIDSEKAEEVERTIKQSNDGLLRGGSAYCNIYTGGSAEPHFCASAMGFGEFFRRANPLRMLAFAIMNAGSILSALAQGLVELLVALSDCVRSTHNWKEVLGELAFIPSRVVVGVVLADLMTVSAGVDIVRGLPLVQLNFLGYDERAHRRGPDSKFAMWSLRRVDRCIRRLWRSAVESDRRQYRVWVYSDHGQERSTPFDTSSGKLINDAVLETFGPHYAARRVSVAGGVPRANRARWLRRAKQSPEKAVQAQQPANPDEIQVVAIGPLGHIYLPAPLPESQLHEACSTLARQGQVPLVLLPREEGIVLAWTADGEYQLPRDREYVFGKEHPFLDNLSEDLFRLCQHPDSGDVLFAGWRYTSAPQTFVYEHGAHGGMAPLETHAFALLPPGTSILRERSYFRPDELRKTAIQAAARQTSNHSYANKRSGRSTIRILCYNVHSCVGMDGQLSIERIAQVLAQCDADVIALQELDANRRRTGFVDQAQLLAEHLGMQAHFHPAISVAEEAYGDAILSHLPLRVMRASALPGRRLTPRSEPRGAIWAQVDTGLGPLQVINTHLGLRPVERMEQIEALLGDQWLGHPDCREPVVLCGDFNAGPRSAPYRKVTSRLRDAQCCLNGMKPKGTWVSTCPLLRIDHIFVSSGLEVTSVSVPRSHFIRQASDHLPLIADVKFASTRVV